MSDLTVVVEQFAETIVEVDLSAPAQVILPDQNNEVIVEPTILQSGAAPFETDLLAYYIIAKG